MPEQRIRDKSRSLRIDVPVAVFALPVCKEPLRHHDVELVFRARHGHVKQTAFLFDLRRRAGGQIGWQTAIDRVEQEDGGPFLSLSGMDRRQHQIVFIEQRQASLVAGGVGRIQREFREEVIAARIRGGDLDKLLQIALADDGIFMNAV